ncbi:MAG: hypothetical protein MJ153_05195 [Clostridia bacterium]|nr:hypothetical protein [Clostridia bacterium]
MLKEDLNRRRAASKYDVCFPLTEAGIKCLLKDYYNRSFLIISNSVYNSGKNHELYKHLEKDINSLGLNYLPFEDKQTGMISVIVFPFNRQGNAFDMYRIIQTMMDWSNSYSQKILMIRDENGYGYCIDCNTNEITNVEALVNAEISDYMNFYLDKLMPESEHSIFTINQPGSPNFAAYPRVLKGEFCMPLIAWRNSYGKLYN